MDMSQSLNRLDRIAGQVEPKEGGEMNVGDFLLLSSCDYTLASSITYIARVVLHPSE